MVTRTPPGGGRALEGALVAGIAATVAVLLATGVLPAASRAHAATGGAAAAIARGLAARTGGSWEEVADTGSMAPALTARHYAVLVPVDIVSVRPRDIVVFRAHLAGDPPDAPWRRVVHRVVGVGGCAPGAPREPACVVLRVQGDANPAPDAVAVTVANFEGRVAFSVDRDDGRVRDLVADPGGAPAAGGRR
jgi:hypothetical protein